MEWIHCFSCAKTPFKWDILSALYMQLYCSLCKSFDDEGSMCYIMIPLIILKHVFESEGVPKGKLFASCYWRMFSWMETIFPFPALQKQSHSERCLQKVEKLLCGLHKKENCSNPLILKVSRAPPPSKCTIHHAISRKMMEKYARQA